MLDFIHLNYWAVLVAAVINSAVGSFWYSPLGFAKTWTKLTGIDMMAMPKADANRAIGIVVLGAVVQSFVLAALVRAVGAVTWLDGLSLGLAIWLGLVAATTLGDMLYARRGWKLWWINASFFLVVISINSVLFAVWR